MSKFIIDANIIIMYPQILSYENMIILADVVLEELERSKHSSEHLNKIFEIITSKLKNNKIEQVAYDNKKIKIKPPGRLSENDGILMDLTSDYISDHPKEDVYLVTQDNELRYYCSISKINNLSLNQLKNKIRNIDTDIDTKRQTKNINKDIKLDIAKRLTILLAFIIISFFLSDYIGIIISQLNVWGTIILLPTIGIFLYYIRFHFRTLYGSIEFAVGVITAIRSFLPDFNYSLINISTGFQILGGLYIIVRGMDNIEKGLEKNHPILSTHWREFFKKKLGERNPNN